MKNIPGIGMTALRRAILCIPLVTTAAQGAPSSATNCQAKIYRYASDYLACRLKAEAALVKGQDLTANKAAQQKCDDIYDRRINSVKKLSGDLCIEHKDLTVGPEPPLEQGMIHEIDALRAAVSGKSPDPVSGKLILYNNCDKPLKIMSPTSGGINGSVLDPYGSKFYSTGAGGDLAQNAPNTFMAAPVTTDAQCAQIKCENWADIQVPGQRMGYMWDNNPVYAAYCQPTNAAAKQCNSASSTPCCGSQMNYDKTFGTTFEITPNTPTKQDYFDLSTNYGSGPYSPPDLCKQGIDPDTCVNETANIFYNVPVRVEVSDSGACAFPQGGTDLICTEASCPDAYKTPTDRKQPACSAGTGYVVTFCPDAHPLPSLGLLDTFPKRIAIKNNVSQTSPCANGNTASIFTSAGGQQAIQPGGNSISIFGDYSSLPGIGIQVNNWYWALAKSGPQVAPFSES
ncbi:glycoside hydrolase 64/thaumatin family protein [Methylococcus mesophilus]|uniref:hypothetical protein n=1 Tax=Methylococcus mesophilus TaxID=2993564 RepID=UPI00224AEA2B|nr:hypothetical protein [Methylococcus mesophilus]UZR27519.1 hypothetical protein OOT43_12320 [Methylococcus mesophilus]